MKRYLTLVTLLLAMVLQSSPALAVDIKAHKQDSISNVLYREGKYEDCIAVLYRLIQMLESPTPDSLYIEAFVKCGRCYDKMGVQMKAIEHAKRALDLYHNIFPEDDIYTATLYNNLSNYFSTMRNYKQAEKWSKKSVEVYRQFKGYTDSRVMVLFQAGQVANNLRKYDEAILYQKEVLELLLNRDGKHSQAYLDNLAWLKRYYLAADNTTESFRIADQHHRLTMEIRDGIIPEPADLSTAEKCHRHNNDALACSRFFLNNYIITPGFRDASDYLIAFRRKTPDVAVYMGSRQKRWFKHTNVGYMVAYIAASTEYALTHQEEQRFTIEQFRAAINRVLGFYEANKNYAGEIKAWDYLLHTRKKHPEEANERIDKWFYEIQDEMRARRGTIEVDTITLLNFDF